MSTIIIVLLVIVLVVAIVLKKRGDNQNTAAPKKGTAGKATKKATAKKTSRTTLAREEQEAAPLVTTAISDSLREKIEQQIQERNFQAAEAQINQALKQDNSQHELYLFLLDIHLAQKDDFAIDQLIKHVHALKLEDIAHAAEAKKSEYEKNKQPDSIDFHSNSSNFNQRPTTTEAAAPQNNTADFDALVQAPSNQSFDDLQTEYVAPVEEEKPAEPAPEVQPLDFNFSFEQKETQVPEASPTPVESETTELKEQTPLEFSFSLEPNTATPEETKVEDEVKTESDFNFSLESVPEPAEASKVEEAPSLDFSFEPTTQTPVDQPETIAEKTEFLFDLAEPTPVATEQTTELTTSEPATQISSVISNDPLVQSFPDLQQLNEAQLNLDLAEQYIELGAYESARTLLQNSQSIFDADQQQSSEKLLNKIAS
ncbi:FimV domain-containing protein [Acinetobacter venetianus]|uniref:hypothetical protein n=1 Tax=Acinetobacter venetianus TaxID=52133 RepID=UPI000775946E|nr:hypothetical protein [Acinetobacter venetianus]KXO86541.1 FimV domain-containing protein [Acinetobacter venetianus]